MTPSASGRETAPLLAAFAAMTSEMDQLSEITQLLKTQTQHQNREVDSTFSRADAFAQEAKSLKANVTVLEKDFSAMHESYVQLRTDLTLMTGSVAHGEIRQPL
ncbi:hypothetical protein SeMB42_g05597 [Synchytrium endobioticum]|uniref:Uncharacterized protein n=1 Tax=Synchytrium endobioticum TaxID=286115 RepID=A0A507CQH4_9FUNG|nr:hypothetical protein SeLEV6574_g07091 [Synchytrium endobioticum]TPX41384.1 hypothetical protein SeMB42_g05597 [Synchytrium endobioticum]